MVHLGFKLQDGRHNKPTELCGPLLFPVNVVLFNGPSPASFSFIFVFSNKQYTFLQQIYVEKCYVHPRYGAGI